MKVASSSLVSKIHFTTKMFQETSHSAARVSSKCSTSEPPPILFKDPSPPTLFKNFLKTELFSQKAIAHTKKRVTFANTYEDDVTTYNIHIFKGTEKVEFEPVLIECALAFL